MASLPLWSFPGFYPQFPGQWWRRAYHQLWDEVERITSSNPADILQQVTNNPQWGPSTCVAWSRRTINMTRSTNIWVRKFESWYSQQPRQQAQLEEIPVQEPDRVIQELYCHVCKMNTSLIAFELCLLHSTDTCQAVVGSTVLWRTENLRRLVLNGKAIQQRENRKRKKKKEESGSFNCA